MSHNSFDPSDRKWHQAWVDTSPSRLNLIGALVDGRMVMEQRTETDVQRITWTPMPDGRVRQLWEASCDGGLTWKPAFDGYYSRRRGAH